MSELDDFRPRILNWSRVYRDRLVRQESNIGPLLRLLRLLNKKPADGRASDEEEPQARVDQTDADLLDSCWKRLPAREKKVLKVAYLTRFHAETYESTEDAFKADRRRADYLRMYVNSYRQTLREAEVALMRMVQSTEIARERLDQNIDG